jgi:hypothetical protein
MKSERMPLFMCTGEAGLVRTAPVGYLNQDSDRTSDDSPGGNELHGVDLYDLLPDNGKVKVAHPPMQRTIAAAKKKNDRIDAGKIADYLRSNFLPEYRTV